MFSSFRAWYHKYVASCKRQIITDVKSMKMGFSWNFGNFIPAIIHRFI
jgi:hypothetical protein